MILRTVGFFLVLFRVKPRWMVQMTVVTGPGTYLTEKHTFAFHRLAVKRFNSQAAEFVAADLYGWSMYLFDTRNDTAVDFICGSYASELEDQLLKTKPDGNLN